jgi:hypothetical protein
MCVISVVSHAGGAGVWFGLAVFVIVMVSSLVTYGRYLSCGLVAAKSFVLSRWSNFYISRPSKFARRVIGYWWLLWGGGAAAEDRVWGRVREGGVDRFEE